MAYSCCFSLGGNLDFLDFLQKMVYNINYREAAMKSVIELSATFRLRNKLIF